MKKILNTLFPLITMVAVSGVGQAADLIVDRQEQGRIFNEARQNLEQLDVLPIEQQAVALEDFVRNERQKGLDFIYVTIANIAQCHLERINELRWVGLNQGGLRGFIVDVMAELDDLHQRHPNNVHLLEANIRQRIQGEPLVRWTGQELLNLARHLMVKLKEVGFADLDFYRELHAPVVNQGALFVAQNDIIVPQDPSN